MEIREDNISISYDIIEEIRTELVSLDDRDKFLSDLVRERLQKCNKLYLDSIDSQVDRLESNIDNLGIDDINKIMTRINRSYRDLYRSQLSLYKILGDINIDE